MSSIGILNGPLAVATMMLIIGAPGLVVGLIAGAVAWKAHRVWGAVVGAAAGWAIGLLAWLYFTGNL
jgi:hypothetical protein